MKFTYKVIFFTIIYLITCNTTLADTLFGEINNCKNLQGHYISPNDYSEIIVKKNTNNEYIISIFLYRLLQMDEVKGYCKNSEINFFTEISENNKVYGSFSKDKKEYIFQVNSSNWEYLPNGTKYIFKKK